MTSFDNTDQLDTGSASDEPAADLFGGSAAPIPEPGPPTAQVAVFDAEAEEAEER